MIKVINIFYQAEDPSLLDDYYYNHYLPKALRIPGIIKIETSRLYTDMKKVFLKESDVTPIYQIISELYFEDLQSFEKGFSSEQGEYIANNVIKVAWDLMTVVIGDVSVDTPEEYKHQPNNVHRAY